MDSKRIEQLLEKYWACETTVEEENELKAFFSEQPVPDHLKEYTPLFQYLDEEKHKALDDSFDEEVLSKLENKKPEKQGKIIKMASWYVKVAAAVLVTIAAAFLLREQYLKSDVRQPVEESLSDAELREKFEEAKEALQKISSALNKGQEQVEKISVFNDAEEKIKGEQKEL
ncbi:MAG: hypothetical protein AAFX87_01945 [Bacteroidota bacterium]